MTGLGTLSWVAAAGVLAMCVILGAAPVFAVRLIGLLYPKGHARRSELKAELAYVTGLTKTLEQWRWIGENLALALCEGTPLRLRHWSAQWQGRKAVLTAWAPFRDERLAALERETRAEVKSLLESGDTAEARALMLARRRRYFRRRLSRAAANREIDYALIKHWRNRDVTQWWLQQEPTPAVQPPETVGQGARAHSWSP